MPLLSDLPPLQPPGPATRFVVVQDQLEYLLSLGELTEYLRDTVTGSGSTGGSGTRTTVTSMSQTLQIGSSGYAAYYSLIISNPVFTLPSITDPTLDLVITVDLKQDATGNRNPTFGNVAGWYDVNPYNISNPPELLMDKRPNAYSMFSFRTVQGLWFGSYNRVV